ncbi:hypothetical protein D6D00_00695 [Aureobasidium pullulans]|nr:hypothetical protein D6D00_00695 [Aureobasidium pullulans]
MDAVIADINTLFVRLTRFYEKLATFTGPDQDVFPHTLHDAQTRQATDPGEYISLRSDLFDCKAVFNKFIAEGPELDAVKATAIQQLQRAQSMMAKIEQADADHAELNELRTLKRKFGSTQNNQETLVKVVRSAATTASKLDAVEKLKQERDDAQAEVAQFRTELRNDSAELTELRQARTLYNNRGLEIGRLRNERQNDSAELIQLRQVRDLYNERGDEIARLRTERQNDSAELAQLRQARVLYNDREFEIGRFRADAAQVQTDRAELARLRLHNTNA